MFGGSNINRIKMNIRQATMADAAVIAAYNVALARESEDMTLETWL